MSFVTSSSFPECTSTVGRIRAIAPSISSAELTCPTICLNFCFLYRRPPTKKVAPKTSSRFESTDPSNDSCTTRINPSLSASQHTMSSVTLPKVAFNRPEITPFVCKASCSVTKDSRSAIGMSTTRAHPKLRPGVSWMTDPKNNGTSRISSAFVLAPPRTWVNPKVASGPSVGISGIRLMRARQRRDGSDSDVLLRESTNGEAR
mmetsp:Transcript_10239/g.26229  ORF Transcript_10239/g.26229 Transcript_10239/m.26229 type:complete len:204 (+) Transcript_10239:1687-2298(+)